MKNILRRILSIWFILLFILFFLVIFPFQFLLLNLRTKWAHDWAHGLNTLWGYVITLPVGIWISSDYRKKVPRKGTYIFAPNHASWLDIPICNIAVKRPYRYLGKSELNKVPLFGYMYRNLYITVNRKDAKDAYRSYRDAEKKLAEGTSVLIYPEGTVYDKFKIALGRFKDGAFRLAIETKTPLVPVTIYKAHIAMPDDGKLLIRPYHIKVRFEDPIDTSNMTLEDVPVLKQRVFNLMYKNITGKEYGNQQ